MVPEKVRLYAGGAGYRCREFHFAWTKNCLLSKLLFYVQRNRFGQAAILRQAECIADFLIVPAASGNVSPGGQILIQLCQRLQNHRTTS